MNEEIRFSRKEKECLKICSEVERKLENALAKVLHNPKIRDYDLGSYENIFRDLSRSIYELGNIAQMIELAAQDRLDAKLEKQEAMLDRLDDND